MKNMKKIFLSETICPRVMILCIQHHLVDLYQLCSNYAPWANNGSPRGWGHIFYIGLYNEKNEIIFLSETIWPIVLIFGT